MEKSLGTLTLINYNDDIIEHRSFKRELLNDTEFRKYFGEMFIKLSDDIFVESDELEIKKAYLVLDKDEIVGMVRIFSYHESGVANIQYAVSPSMRKKGYGKLILKEFTTFLLKNGITSIEGEISSSNIGSIKVALDLGFEKHNDKYRLRSK